MTDSQTINVNVCVVGHVDAGKTTLCKYLSTVASTAAFDKSPQSQSRGITLDLGFSECPLSPFVNATLVDCPGHASLLKTVLCGTCAVDAALIIIDAQKGFQIQTVESLVLSSITTSSAVAVLTKTDLLPSDSRSEKLSESISHVKAVLSKTKFSSSPVIPLSSFPPSPDDISSIRSAILSSLDIPSLCSSRKEREKLPLCIAADHCFSITGRGTILTATILSGTLSSGSSLSSPSSPSLSSTVKSLQVFHNPVSFAGPGDRVGISISGALSPASFSRGLFTEPSAYPPVSALLVTTELIRPHRSPVCSKFTYQIALGPAAPVSAHIRLFSSCGSLYPQETPLSDVPDAQVLLELSSPLSVPPSGLYVALRPDVPSSQTSATCRIAFHGTVLKQFSDIQTAHKELKLYSPKNRTGIIDRAVDARTAVIKGLFAAGTPPDVYEGLVVDFPEYPCKEGEDVLTAVIDGQFGKGGRQKVTFSRDVTAKDIRNQKVVLNYKKYLDSSLSVSSSGKVLKFVQ